MNGIIAFGELHGLFAWLYELLASTGLPQPWLDIVRYLALGAMMFGVLSLIALFLVWWERKIAGHLQQRFGPMRNGWHGWYQTVFDALKLLSVSITIPNDLNIRIPFVSGKMHISHQAHHSRLSTDHSSCGLFACFFQ